MNVLRNFIRLIAGLLVILNGQIFSQETLTQPEAEEIIRKMEAAYEGVQDYVSIFNKQERIDGELLPMETIRLKFKKPFSVYMRWIEEPRKGMEVIYVRGENDGKMVAHPGSFPDITVKLDPDGKLAMRQNRHPVTDVGIGSAIQIIAKDVQRAGAHPEDSVKYQDHGIQDVNGEEARCIEALMPADEKSGYYAHRAFICYETETNLLSQIKIWDHTNTLVENYRYSRIETNVGLSEIDFDADNPDYEF